MGPFLTAAMPILGQGIKYLTDQIGRNQQLRYNSPENQIRRLRSAGLPYAAFAAGQAGNQQSPISGTTGGLEQVTGQIAQHHTTKKTIEEIAKIREDVTREKLLNEKLSGELAWYRAGAGTDPSRTNLTSMLGLEQQMKTGQNIGMSIANETARNSLNNQPLKISLENQEQRQRITNMIQTHNKGEIEIEGEKLNNALKELEVNWKPRMNEANLDNILKRNGILVTEQGLKQLQLAFEQDTFDNNLTMSNMAAATAKMGYDILGANFRQTQAWQEMVAESQRLFNMNKGKGGTLGDLMKSMGAFAYTLFGNNTGSIQMPNLPSYNPKTFSTFNTQHHYGND